MFSTLVSFSCALMLCIIFGLPAAAVYLLVSAVPGGWQVAAVVIGPLLYAVLFVTTAGLLSLPFQKCIIRGKFPRNLRHPVYRGRRFYGTCWTALYYCKPVYYLCLTLPWLKWLTFRLFGYRGQLDFTVYPDTWIRDLPLLDLGKGVYVANRATLGTNMPLKNGKILVDGIRIGDRSLIGHLTMLAAGVQVGRDAEIESGCAMGLRVKVGDEAFIGGTCLLYHFAMIGDGTAVEAGTRIGFKVRVPANSKVPAHGSLESNRRRGNGEGSLVSSKWGRAEE